MMNDNDFDKELAAILDNGRRVAVCWDCKDELECYSNITWAHSSSLAAYKCIGKYKRKALGFSPDRIVAA